MTCVADGGLAELARDDVIRECRDVMLRHPALTHHEFMEMVEIIRALGNSYRLAALEPGSGFLYGRFTFNFCRVVVSCVER